MKKNSILLIILSCLTMGLHAQKKTTYWYNGNFKSITDHDKDGKKTGYWKMYFLDGELKESGSYKSGKKSGTWYEYYYNGRSKKRTTYSNGLITRERVYYENGRNMVSGSYDDNEKKHGLWEQYYDNWQQKLKGEYDHGKKHGQWKYFKENGKLFKIKNYKTGLLISKWEYNDENVSKDVAVDVAEETEIVESTTDAIEDAAEAVEETRSYRGDRFNGEWKFYNENGKIIEIGNYLDGKKDGKWTNFYVNGQIEKVQLWKKGKLMEVLSYFNEKGTPFEKGTLKYGSGTVKEYDAENVLITITEYVNGQVLDWNDSNRLNTLAWRVYENETDIESLNKAIKWVKRSIELEKSYYNTDTYAALLYKKGNYQQALILAKEAIKIAKKDKDSYSDTTKLIEQINKKIKK